MSAVLLGLTRFDALHLDSEPHPPNRQTTHALDRARRERTAVIGANARRQAILAENPFESLLGAFRLGALHRFTAEQIPAMKVRHRQRITVLRIRHAELPFEVGAP